MRPALRQRAVRQVTEGQIAKRDLARYYLLLGSVLLDDRLTRSEAAWLARAAFSKAVDGTLYGGPFVPEHVDPNRDLLAIVEHSIRGAERVHKPCRATRIPRILGICSGIE